MTREEKVAYLAYDIVMNMQIEKEAKEEDRTKFWHDRFWSAFKNNIGALAASGAVSAVQMKKIIKNGDGEKLMQLMAKNKLAQGAGAAGAGATAALRLKHMHKKELGTNPEAKDYAKTVLSASAPYTAQSIHPSLGLAGGVASFTNTPEAIVKAKKREATKQAACESYDLFIEKIAEEIVKNAL
jgi:hypothetical protein